MVSFGHAAYLGIGAYAVGILALRRHPHPASCSGRRRSLASALVRAALIGALSLRTRGVYFIMITLAFAQMLYYLGVGLNRYGGDDGLHHLQRSQFAGVARPRRTRRSSTTSCLALLFASSTWCTGW